MREEERERNRFNIVVGQLVLYQCERERERERETDRETETETDRQTERQTDRQRQSQRDREMHNTDYCSHSINEVRIRKESNTEEEQPTPKGRKENGRKHSI